MPAPWNRHGAIILESGRHRRTLGHALAADTPLGAELAGGAEALRAIRNPEQAVVALVTTAASIPRVLHEDWTPAGALRAAQDLRALAGRLAGLAAIDRPARRIQALEDAARLARAAVAPADQSARIPITA